MALRELAFDIAFKGDAKAVMDMNSAVDKVKDSTVNMGNTIETQTKKGTSAFKTMAKYVAGAFSVAAVANFGKQLINTASDVEEMQGKFDVVFDGMQGSVTAWSEQQAKAMGRSKYEIQGYLADSQNMFVGMGMTREAGADLSKQMTTLAIDLASFNNLQDADAVEKLNKALMGETESAKSLGAVLNENTLAAAMNQMGINKNWKELSEAEKMQVRYQAIVMQSADAMGDAERTSGSFANQMRALKANAHDTMAEMGQALLPVASKVLQVFNGAIPVARDLAEKGFALIGNIGSQVMEKLRPFVPYVLQIKDAFVTAMQNIIPNVMNLWNSIQSNLMPIIGALLNKVMENMPTIQSIISSTFNVVSSVISIAVKGIDLFVRVIGGVYEKIKPVLDLIGSAFDKVFGGVSKIVGGASNVLSKLSGSGGSAKIGRNARGTNYWGGGLTMVGEEGPELVNLPTGSKVSSTPKTARMMGGGASFSNSINITINGSGGNARELANNVRREVERALETQNKKMMLRLGGI